jgi:hypothetical protein
MSKREQFQGLTVNQQTILIGDQGSVCYAGGRNIGQYPYGASGAESMGVWVGGEFKSVHQLVARAWLSWHYPKPPPLVHLNGDRSDNRLTNLRIRAHTPEEYVYRNKHSFAPQDEPEEYVGVGQEALDSDDGS